MQPKEFILSKKEHKRYLNALMRMPGTQLHKQLVLTRAMSAVIFVAIAGLAFLVQLPGALRSPGSLQTLGVTTLVEFVVLAFLAWFMPPWSLRRRQMRMEKLNGMKGDRFRETSRVWVEDGFYIRQTGSATANRLPLARLQWARLGEGCGVVLQFENGMCDYVPVEAFHAGCPAPAWCRWLMEQADAARQQDLGEPVPPAVADGEGQVCFTLEREELGELLAEMSSLVMRTGGYWRYLAPQLVVLVLVLAMLIPMAFTEPLLAAVLGLMLALVVVMRLPPVQGRLVRRQAKRPEMNRFLGPQSLTLTPEGVLVRRSDGDSLIRYELFRRVLAGKKGVYLLLRSGVQAHVIPNGAFADEEARQAFIRQARERIGGR